VPKECHRRAFCEQCATFFGGIKVATSPLKAGLRGWPRLFPLGNEP
jgi:hypothetical protein